MPIRYPTDHLSFPAVTWVCALSMACSPTTKTPGSSEPAQEDPDTSEPEQEDRDTSEPDPCGGIDDLTEAVGEFHTSFEDEGDRLCSAFWLITGSPRVCESCDLWLEISGRIHGADCEWDFDLDGDLEFQDDWVTITAISFTGHAGRAPVTQVSDCHLAWDNQEQVDEHHETHGSDAFFPHFSGFVRW